MADIVKRKIYYYDISLSIKSTTIDKCEKIKKRGKRSRISDQSAVIREIFSRIKKKQDAIATETDENKRKILQKDFQIETEKKDILYVLVDQLEDKKPIKFRMVLCRNNAFPFFYKDGKLELLTNKISGEFSLAEITHCVIFTDHMTMGAEFNFNGARPSSIAAYIMYMYKEVYFMECHGKMNNDAVEKIVENVPLSLFRIGMKNTPQICKLIEENKFGIGAFVRAMPPEISDYEVVLRRRKTQKNRGFDSPMTLDQYRAFISQNREDITKFEISQGTYNDSIDLLKDKLVHTVPIDIETKGKTIISDYMYSQIEMFYYGTVVKEYDEKE